MRFCAAAGLVAVQYEDFRLLMPGGAVQMLAAEAGAVPRTVVKDDKGTWIEGLKLTGEFREDD